MFDTTTNLDAISKLVLDPGHCAGVVWQIAQCKDSERTQLAKFSERQHVLVRAFGSLHDTALRGGFRQVAEWADNQAQQHQRDNLDTLDRLSDICCTLDREGCPVTVIKSLDHWPDMANDIDLYTLADDKSVVRIFREKLHASLQPRKLAEKMAHKWNFRISGLDKDIEVHVGRLGQTGEHVVLSRRFADRAVQQRVATHTFRVPAPEERVMAAALQRMYRHFYFRLTDIVNTAAMIDGSEIDYDELRHSAEAGGIWAGVATYLTVVSDYAGSVRGTQSRLPDAVRQASLFGSEKIFVRAQHIRIPLFPEAIALYTMQLLNTIANGDAAAVLRLAAQPPIVSVVEIKERLKENPSTVVFFRSWKRRLFRATAVPGRA
jgi:hypothetical protein